MNAKTEWLNKHCYVTNPEDGDRFVGFKICDGEPFIYFPLGYHLSDDDKDIRADLLKLFTVLYDFATEAPDILTTTENDTTAFPLKSYVKVIKHYLEYGYYTEKEAKYTSKSNGNIHWGRTIKSKLPLLQSDSNPIYTTFIARQTFHNMNNLLSTINKYCIAESFDKIGWIFTTYTPQPVYLRFDIKLAISIVNQKLLHTYSDQEKSLFTAMKNILEYMDSSKFNKNFLFGTVYFESIWEKIIDKIFGIYNKQEYFPKTRWYLSTGLEKTKYPLEPDSIMIINNKYYVLDAKYYRYGVTGNPNHLPDSSSINKQITYGEFIAKHKNLDDESLYNAFIMPFDSKNNSFNTNDEFYNVGEAVGDWKPNTKNYEKIQGIVVDTKTLIDMYCARNNTYKELLAAAIRKE